MGHFAAFPTMCQDANLAASKLPNGSGELDPVQEVNAWNLQDMKTLLGACVRQTLILRCGLSHVKTAM